MAFNRISYWLWGVKDPETPSPSVSPSPDLLSGFMEIMQFPLGNGPSMRSSSRRIKKKWQSREERRINKEYDIVIVPSDGGCISGSESDGSDYSIGWEEPHGSGFLVEGEPESSFSVLVPCYGRGRAELPSTSINQVPRTSDRVNESPSENENFIEQLLSSLSNT